MLRLRRALGPAICAVAVSTSLGACEGASNSPAGGVVVVPGYANSSSSDFEAVSEALRDDDTDGAQARGRALWKMQRALDLGSAALVRDGGARPPRVVGLASIDPAGSSGEVAYFGWDGVSLDDGRAAPEEARRWVVVSVTLDPDEAFEPVEIRTAPTPTQIQSLAAVELALARAVAEHPGGSWSVHVFRERAPDAPGAKKSKKSKRSKARGQTRVYLLGRDGNSPDLELTVLDGAKARDPSVLTRARTHLVGAAAARLEGGEALVTVVSPPGPPSFARAFAQGAILGEAVEIVDASGARHRVAPR